MARERIATHPTGRSNRWSVRSPESLSGDRIITSFELETWQAFGFDPNGSNRNVDLPAEEGAAGAYVLISHTGNGNDLVVRNDATSTVATVTVNEAVLLWCDGIAWRPIVGANT